MKRKCVMCDGLYERDKFYNKCKNFLSSYCKECEKIRVRNRREKWPWYKTYSAIHSRCYKSGRKYFDKGIKNLLSIKDLRYLWFRDKAWLLDRPSINRINPDGNYVIENCEYIELSDNIRAHR